MMKSISFIKAILEATIFNGEIFLHGNPCSFSKIHFFEEIDEFSSSHSDWLRNFSSPNVFL